MLITSTFFLSICIYFRLRLPPVPKNISVINLYINLAAMKSGALFPFTGESSTRSNPTIFLVSVIVSITFRISYQPMPPGSGVPAEGEPARVRGRLLPVDRRGRSWTTRASTGPRTGCRPLAAPDEPGRTLAATPRAARHRRRTKVARTDPGLQDGYEVHGKSAVPR